ncbi:FACT complex subunit-domain-containing protein [Gymnopilus junonius]|uniref:FACT complex subunit n=1 Tax=Gymnopilus junonius TaxID=109634 RepID=A0A9P5NTG5_GYMJU|nr:FACT complex subunit-domain-containing protein [Gymnopilus junonius]
MADTQLNKTIFADRVRRIYDAWANARETEDYESIADVDALFLIAGDPTSDDEPMPKILSQVENAVKGIPIEILARPKGKDVANEALPKFLALYTSAKRVGSLVKEVPSGKLVSEWQGLVNKSPSKPKLFDIAPAISTLMAIKDEEELKYTQTAAVLTSTLLKHHVAPKLESILDKETKITHDMLAAQIETRLGSGEGSTAKGPDMKVWSKGKGLENKVDWPSVEFCYPPIIISKSSKSGYDLRYTVESSDDNIAHKGVFLVSFGIRYRSYSTSIGRTFIVDPNPTEMLSYMKEGVSARDVYQFALAICLTLVDTIKIDESRALLLTEGIKSSKDTYSSSLLKSSGKKPPPAPLKNGSPVKQKTIGGKVLRNQTRRAVQDEVHQTAMAKLIEHQRELHENLQNQGLARFSESGGGSNGKEGKGWKKFQSYKGEGALPTDVDKLRIIVDRKAQTVVLPIHGFAVPFHINTIKNASKSDEGDFTYLRINFQTPGQLAGKKRILFLPIPDGHRLDNIVKQINDLKKEANKREQQRRKWPTRPIKMPEAFIRPALDGKRLPGEVEIHQNGIRYQSMGSQKVDILFSNIKHLFFQPCDHELLVIVHLHLKAPIMIGKKKAFFFREATDVQFDETGNRKRKHRYGDEDEIEMEQQERKRRALLNKEIKAFAEKVAEAASTSNGETLELDIPFRELSFEGVPFRTSARLQPTTECLVHLTDPPFLVVTLSEIEIASLERVQYGLRQFDLVFIFKDFTKPPLHINSIQSSQMDDVKNWLDSVDIPMSEGPVNLNWGPIMKHINENPFEFFQQGGWKFLGNVGGEESEHSSESESESEFEADSEDQVESLSSNDESDYDDSDASGSDGSGSDFGGGGDDSDEGDDWDELERKAAKADQRRAEAKKANGSDDSDDERRKKKPVKTNGKINGKNKR